MAAAAVAAAEVATVPPAAGHRRQADLPVQTEQRAGAGALAGEWAPWVDSGRFSA